MQSLLQELAELEFPDLKRWIKQHPDTITWEFKKWVGEHDHGSDAELADRVGLSIVQLEAEAGGLWVQAYLLCRKRQRHWFGSSSSSMT